MKCEIHDCTIALFGYLFRDIVPEMLLNELNQSKKDRIDSQYYSMSLSVDLNKLRRETKHFVLEVQKLSDGVGSQSIESFRRKVASF